MKKTDCLELNIKEKQYHGLTAFLKNKWINCKFYIALKDIHCSKIRKGLIKSKVV